MSAQGRIVDDGQRGGVIQPARARGHMITIAGLIAQQGVLGLNGHLEAFQTFRELVVHGDNLNGHGRSARRDGHAGGQGNAGAVGGPVKDILVVGGV